MDHPSRGENEEVRGEYTLIPVVTTPKISRGDKITLDYYVAGRHPDDNPPEYVRLNVNLDGISVESAQVSQNIVQQWEDDGTSLYLKKEKESIIHRLPEHKRVFSLKFPESMFFPNNSIVDGDDPYSSPPIHGELDIDEDGTPPYKLEIQTAEDQAAGDHEITSTLIYEQDNKAGTDRVQSQIHVNTWYEEYQFWINTIIIVLTLIGVFFPVFRFLLL